ncbi:MAG: rod shape-determining protein [Desulfovibrionaceae bacterium]|nr:rod shape-determining protein [Desulfovibrionaceae bacterium]
MLWQAFKNLFSQDIAMDLGTANTLLYTKRHGMVINEPSVVALDLEKNKVVAVGKDAKRFMGRTPKNLVTIRPLKEGVIADFDMTQAMISYFVRKTISNFRLFKPSFVICIPMGITQVEKKAVIDSAALAGASEVKLVEEPMAAAIGSGLNVHAPQGHMVLDIGGGTSEVAVISLDGIATSESIRIAGDAMNMEVQRYIREVFRIEVGENSAEEVKIALGAAIPQNDLPAMQVSGKDVVQGAPCRVTLTEGHVREALAGIVRLIGDAVLRCLEVTPPELAADIFQNGLLLAGGGSLLRGLDQFLSHDTNVPVIQDKDPLTTVLRGTAQVMLDPKGYKHIFIN